MHHFLSGFVGPMLGTINLRCAPPTYDVHHVAEGGPYFFSSLSRLSIVDWAFYSEGLSTRPFVTKTIALSMKFFK